MSSFLSFFANLSEGDFLSLLGIGIDVISVFFAVVVFVITSKSEEKATREQSQRERVRATLSEVAELRRTYPNFADSLRKCSKHKKMLLTRAYVADIERFAVGCNREAYDISVVNDMCGGLFIQQYQLFFKPYIIDRRSHTERNHYVKNDTLYKEIDIMMERLCKLRGVKYEEL